MPSPPPSPSPSPERLSRWSSSSSELEGRPFLGSTRDSPNSMTSSTFDTRSRSLDEGSPSKPRQRNPVVDRTGSQSSSFRRSESPEAHRGMSRVGSDLAHRLAQLRSPRYVKPLPSKEFLELIRMRSANDYSLVSLADPGESNPSNPSASRPPRSRLSYVQPRPERETGGEEEEEDSDDGGHYEGKGKGKRQPKKKGIVREAHGHTEPTHRPDSDQSGRGGQGATNAAAGASHSMSKTERFWGPGRRDVIYGY